MRLSGQSNRRFKALRVLGLSSAAGPEEIRRAFRRRAFDCHPDRHLGIPEMERRFKELNESYRFLVEEPSAGSWEGSRKEPPSSPIRGQDLYYFLHLDFGLAAFGGEVLIRLEKPTPCPRCKKIDGSNWTRCGGSGETTEEATLKVSVPSGIDDGQIIRLAGEGAHGVMGGEAGDLFLTVRCKEHPELKRDGLDVYGSLSLSRERLRQGGVVQVRTLRGVTNVRIPPNSSSGNLFRLRGWGLRRVREGRIECGDFLFVINDAHSGSSGSVAAYSDWGIGLSMSRVQEERMVA